MTCTICNRETESYALVLNTKHDVDDEVSMFDLFEGTTVESVICNECKAKSN